MRSVPFDFNGQTYDLAFTADAMIRCMEKFDGAVDVIGASKCGENTLEGLSNACWLGALFASQGELQRRYRGEDPRPMLSAQELRLHASPVELLELRRALSEAVALGLRRSVTEDAEEEVDAVLAERSAAEKKTRILVDSIAAGLLRVQRSLAFRSGRSTS